MSVYDRTPEQQEVAEELYVIYYDGKPLRYKFQEKEPSYYGGKASKRIYFSRKDALAGLRSVPKEFEPEKLSIVRYTPDVCQCYTTKCDECEVGDMCDVPRYRLALEDVEVGNADKRLQQITHLVCGLNCLAGAVNAGKNASHYAKVAYALVANHGAEWPIIPEEKKHDE